MARNDNEIWYAAMRELGESPGTEPLSAEEAWAEYVGSPLPERVRRGRSRRARRSVTPLLLAAAGLAVVVAASVMVYSSWSSRDAHPGKDFAVVPKDDAAPSDAVLPTDEPKEVPPPGVDQGTPPGADKGESSGESEETEIKSRVEVDAEGRFVRDGVTLTREEAEEYFSDLDTPYHVSTEHILLCTNGGIDFGDRMAARAESAYRDAYHFFGVEPKLTDGLRMPIYVTRDIEGYNQLGAYWGDSKSSQFYAFTSRWFGLSAESQLRMPWYSRAFDLISVTLYAKSESLTEIYVTQVTVDQFVRRLLGRESIEDCPAWFVDGVAAYLSRWEETSFFGWSGERLGALGGAPPLPNLFRAFEPDERHILAAGLLVSFLKSEASTDELRAAFNGVVLAVNRGSLLRESFDRLEQALEEAEVDLNQYAGI